MEGDLVEEKVISNKRGRDDDDDDEKGVVGRLEKRASGVVVLEEYNGDEMINGVKYEEEKETTPTPNTTPSPSLFNQLITNLVHSPKSNEHQQEAESDKINQDKCKANGEDDKDDANINIVDRLPRTLSEDTAPATDEASILIHSIIHD